MLKRVEEDWSYFNQAVREKAEGKPRQEAPPLKLVTSAPTPNKPAPPMPPPVQPSSATAVAPTGPSRPQPLNAGRGIASKLLFGIAVIVMLIALIALIEAMSRNAHSINPAVPGGAANGTVGTGGTEKVVTNYNTFNTVTYRSWKVVTGWRFADSRATQPVHQYCYLEVLTTGGQQIYDIEERAPVRRHERPGALIPGLDKAAWNEAATKCVWHR